MVLLVFAFLVGSCATGVMDLWTIARKRVWGTAPPNYALVGRWLAHVCQGRFRHDSIAAAKAVPGERMIGWAAHYVIGISFAIVLLGLWGLAWIHHPSIGPALAVGLGSVAAPFLLMQPGMGAGIAASRTANPRASRMQSLATHAIFGIGLYVGGWVTHFLYLLVSSGTR